MSGQDFAPSSDVADNAAAVADIESDDITSTDLSDMASASDLADLQSDINDIESDDITSGSLSGYATVSWVENQGCGGGGVEGLGDYLSVDGTTDPVVFSGANIYVQSESGSTTDGGTILGLGNLIIGYDEDTGDDDGLELAFERLWQA